MITSIALENFRNFTTNSFDQLSPITIMTGPNGVGKTNILESIALAGGSDWRRYRRLGELVNWDESYAAVELSFNNRNFETIRYVVKGNKAQYLIDKQISRASDVQARVAVMAFSPEMVTLFSGEPELRRQFLNNLLTPIYPEYAEALSTYQKVLKRRNAALRQQQRSHLSIWEEQLAESAAILLLSRQWGLHVLSETIEMDAKAFYKPSPRKVEPLLVFENDLREMVQNNAGNVREFLREKWEGLREKELAVGFSLMGPQRDDWGLEGVFKAKSKKQKVKNNNEDMKLDKNSERDGTKRVSIEKIQNSKFKIQKYNNQQPTTDNRPIDIGIYGSRGQERVGVIQVQLAALTILEEILSFKPVWLLDDVFGELDTEHQAHVVEACQKYQSFITTTNRNYEGIRELIELPETKVISLGDR